MNRRDFLQLSVMAAATAPAIARAASAAAPRQPRANAVHVTWTDESGRYQLSERPGLRFGAVEPTGASKETTIHVDPATKDQPVLGFGHSMVETSVYLLLTLSAQDRQAVLDKLFSPKEGNANLLRIALGSSDFVGYPYYSYDDMPSWKTDKDLSEFSIQKDIKYGIVRLIKQAQAINPDIKILASMWSPPGWMKTNDSLLPGKLESEYIPLVAAYLRKAVQAYADQGISIDYITPQNEPEFCNNTYPQTCLSWEQERALVEAMHEEFKAHGIDTQIWIGDMTMAHWDDFVKKILEDPAVRPLVDGVAWHPYGGYAARAGYLHDAYPDVPQYFSERQLPDTVQKMRSQLADYFRNWVRAWISWVPVRASDGSHVRGPFKHGGGGVTVYPDGTYTLDNQYYFYTQISKYVKRGAHRIASDFGSPSFVTSVAFQNPDGEVVLLLMNESDAAKPFEVVWANRSIAGTLPAKTVGTYRWETAEGAPSRH
jgi:O-glycosyl hydrolase